MLARLVGQPRGVDLGRRAAHPRRRPRARPPRPPRGRRHPRPVHVRAHRGQARPGREDVAARRGRRGQRSRWRPPRCRSPSASVGATPTSTTRPRSSPRAGRGCWRSTSRTGPPSSSRSRACSHCDGSTSPAASPGSSRPRPSTASTDAPPTWPARAHVHRLRPPGDRRPVRRAAGVRRGRPSAGGHPGGDVAAGHGRVGARRPSRSATWTAPPGGSGPPTTGRSRSATAAS